MTKNFEMFDNACITCGRMKHIIADEFNDILVIDHIEPEKLGLPLLRNKNILSVTDILSGYVATGAKNYQKADDNISIIINTWIP